MRNLVIAHVLGVVISIPLIIGVIYILIQIGARPGPFGGLVGFVCYLAVYLFGQYVPRSFGGRPNA